MSVFQARLTRSAFGGKSALILEGFSAVNHQTVDYYINESLFFSVKSDQGRHKRVLKDVDDRFGLILISLLRLGTYRFHLNRVIFCWISFILLH